MNHAITILLSALSTLSVFGYSGNIEGSLFYNDMRQAGNFAWRFDESGQRGAGQNLSGIASSSSVNWLGALDVTVRLYEIGKAGDPSTIDPIDQDQVASDGSYTLSFSGTGKRPDLGVLFELSFTNENRAFQVVDASGRIYTYWHPDASLGSPMGSVDGSTTMGSAYFGSASPAYDNAHHQAALVFASMVDATRVWHEGERWVGEPAGSASEGAPAATETPVPFLMEDYGSLTVNFPKGSAGGGYGKSPTEINIGAPGSTAWTKWHNGNLTAHEYGHALHQRAWEAGYGYDGAFAQPWSKGSREEPFIAFKEAWANFVSATTFEENGTDHSEADKSISSYDIQPYSGRPYGTFSEGHMYPGNVAWFLYDCYDSIEDDDTGIPGEGDQVEISLYVLWSNLRGAWDVASTSEREIGLGALEFISHYLKEVCSVGSVGAVAHMRHLELLSDQAYQNGIGHEIGVLTLDESGAALATWDVADSSLSRFFEVVAPGLAGGALDVQLGTSADGVLAIHDSDGLEIGAVNETATGSSELLRYTAVQPAVSYYVRCGATQYEATGSFALDLHFSLFTGSSLALRQTMEGLEITWDETAAVLEHAVNLQGPWTELPDASSPFIIDTLAPQGFFRLRSAGP